LLYNSDRQLRWPSFGPHAADRRRRLQQLFAGAQITSDKADSFCRPVRSPRTTSSIDWRQRYPILTNCVCAVYTQTLLLLLRTILFFRFIFLFSFFFSPLFHFWIEIYIKVTKYGTCRSSASSFLQSKTITSVLSCLRSSK